SFPHLTNIHTHIISSSAPIGLHPTLFPLASLIFLLTLTAYLSRREKVGLNSMSANDEPESFSTLFIFAVITFCPEHDITQPCRDSKGG
ncbi:hypothetical protein ACU6Z3_28045, partial [Klebsiella aerogenes]